MMDRTVDVTLLQPGSGDRKLYFANGTLWTNYGTTTVTNFFRRRQKRVPTGGKALPQTEKPFYSLTTSLTPPTGSFRTGEGFTNQYTIYAGNLVWSVIKCGVGNSGPNQPNLSFLPQWPPDYNGETVRYQYTGGAPGINPDLLSQAEVKALNKLRDKSGQADFDPGIWFGERRETARLFAEGAYGILNLARALAQKDYKGSMDVLRDVWRVQVNPKRELERQRRLQKYLDGEKARSWTTAMRTLKQVEDAVLTYNLGISPLVSDLQKAHQLLLTGDLTSKMTVKSVGKFSNLETGQRVLTRDLNRITQTTTMSVLHGYTVTLKAVPLPGEVAAISKLGLTNPANLAYQLTGLTFLVDYFVALGPFLDSLNVPMEFHWREGSRTQRFICTIRNEHVSLVGGKCSPGVFVSNFTERVLYSTFPVPIPPLSLKGKDLTAKQSVNSGLIAMKKFRALVGL